MSLQPIPPSYKNSDDAKIVPPNPEEASKKANQVIQQKYASFDGLVLKIVRKMCKHINSISEKGKTRFIYRHAYDFTPTTAKRLQLYLLQRDLPYVVNVHKDSKGKRTGHIKISWDSVSMQDLKKNKQRIIHELQSWCVKHSRKAEKYWERRCRRRDEVRGTDDQTVIGDEMDLLMRQPSKGEKFKKFFRLA